MNPNQMTLVVQPISYEQLAAICDRVLIFHDGQIVSTLVGDQITKDRITQQCYVSRGTLRPDTETRIPA